MKIIIYKKNIVFCQKKDILMAQFLNNNVPETILEKIREFPAEKFIKFTEPDEVEFLKRCELILSYDQVANNQNLSKEVATLKKMLKKLQALQKKTYKNGEQCINIQLAIETIEYKLGTIESFKNGTTIIPPIPYPDKIKIQIGNYVLYASYNEDTFYIKKLNGEEYSETETVDPYIYQRLLIELNKRGANIKKNIKYTQKTNNKTRQLKLIK